MCDSKTQILLTRFLDSNEHRRPHIAIAGRSAAVGRSFSGNQVQREKSTQRASRRHKSHQYDERARRTFAPLLCAYRRPPARRAGQFSATTFNQAAHAASDKRRRWRRRDGRVDCNARKRLAAAKICADCAHVATRQMGANQIAAAGRCARAIQSLICSTMFFLDRHENDRRRHAAVRSRISTCVPRRLESSRSLRIHAARALPRISELARMRISRVRMN